MPSLSKELRGLLEKTIADENGARQIAEAGAEQSLQRLAVDSHEAHSSLTPEEKKLRSELRAHGRQLGDKIDPQRGDQTINHLKQAVAYEHWHRLLFARFLAENDLLLHPEHGVALSLDEVKGLALGQGRDWIDLAAEYAQRMLLREVFRSDDPVLRVPLSPEKRRDLEEKLNSLPREIFLADDSLGWVYQFWQKDAKEEVNKSSQRVGADELSPVTQLFTEDYMVLFLLENTLGAWWAAQHDVSDLPGYTWSYLRLNEDGSPVAGRFSGWPKRACNLKVLDPSMGSGHFLIFALPILARMRAAEESLSLADAVIAVLRDNIFGLELDPRCSQIAAFNLALTAWKLVGYHVALPPLNLACSGLGINAKEEDWVNLAGNDSQAVEGMRRLFSLFKDAPLLGSLIDPLRLKADLYSAGVDRLLPLLEKALEQESSSEDVRELVVAAQGMLAAFRILADHFTLIMTNVPYLLKAKQCEELQRYCSRYAPDATADLATVFIERCAMFCEKGGSHATVSPQNWLFLKSYSKFRHRLLTDQEVHHVAAVGSGATATASWDVLRALLISTPGVVRGDYDISGIDTDAAKEEQRALDLRFNSVMTARASDLLASPSCRIALSANTKGLTLSFYASSLQGVSTGDKPRFQAYFWEVLDFESIWAFQQGVVPKSVFYGGRDSVIRWDQGQGDLIRSEGSAIRGIQALGQRGVVISQMRNLPATLYSGTFFDTNVAVILPKDQEHLSAIFAYCSSDEFPVNVRQLDKKLSVTNGTFGEVPFDLLTWRKIANQKFPNGLPLPCSSDPAQWVFSGHPRESANPLQVAVARLVGYRWPRQTEATFIDCTSLTSDGLEAYAAGDGIVCLSAIAGEENAGARLRILLQAAFGGDYNLSDLLTEKKSETLEDWLRDEFFVEHCRVFQQHPFVWHIWDGLKDGFHALVNYHKLDHSNLEKLIFSYLGDWLTRQRQDVQNGVEGADTRLAAAEHLQCELKKILEGENPYDIFVRWKSLDKQPIGWEPDLNDGVRMNIRPWITEAKLYKATKPGILRVTPNIKYAKDRGKEPKRDPKEFPWFAKSTDRINDVHLSLDEKRRARGLE